MTQSAIVVGSPYEAKTMEAVINLLTSGEFNVRTQLLASEHILKEQGLNLDHVEDMCYKLMNSTIILSGGERVKINYKPRRVAMMYGRADLLDNKEFQQKAERLLGTKCVISRGILWRDSYDFLVAHELPEVLDGIKRDLQVREAWDGHKVDFENCKSVIKKAFSQLSGSELPLEYEVGTINILDKRLLEYPIPLQLKPDLLRKWTYDWKPQMTKLLVYLKHDSFGEYAYMAKAHFEGDNIDLNAESLSEQLFEWANDQIPDQLILEMNPAALSREVGLNISAELALEDLKDYIQQIKLAVFKEYLLVQLK